VFAPTALARQFAVLCALETGMITMTQLSNLLSAVASNFSSRARLIKSLEEQQSNASTQDEWMDLAERMDSLNGNDVWRSVRSSSSFVGCPRVTAPAWLVFAL
jgi:TAG lipase/steryl ester hydrolase/phospholipase A2/LPA acyltransferase